MRLQFVTYKPDYFCPTLQVHGLSCIDIESLSQRTSMTFREEKLEEILGKFTTNGPIEVKPKRKRIPHEKQFIKICENLKLHLGGTNIETDIFEGLKAVIQRDFENDFKSKRIKIFAPKFFLSKFPEVIDYEQYIKKIDELKIIQDINELKEKLEKEFDQGKKARLDVEIEKMKDNKFYTEIRALEKDEVAMAKDLHNVKGEKAEKKVFQAIEKYFSSTKEGLKEEVVVFYSFNFMGKIASKDLKPEEKDFILINFTKRYIMPLEVKTNFHPKSLKKSVKQAKLYIPSTLNTKV